MTCTGKNRYSWRPARLTAAAVAATLTLAGAAVEVVVIHVFHCGAEIDDVDISLVMAIYADAVYTRGLGCPRQEDDRGQRGGGDGRKAKAH